MSHCVFAEAGQQRLKCSRREPSAHVIEERRQVRDRSEGGPRGVEVWVPHHAGEHGVAAVAVTEDRDPMRVSEASSEDMIHRVGQIVLHGGCPGAERRGRENRDRTLRNHES